MQALQQRVSGPRLFHNQEGCDQCTGPSSQKETSREGGQMGREPASTSTSESPRPTSPGALAGLEGEGKRKESEMNGEGCERRGNQEEDGRGCQKLVGKLQ